MGNSKSVETVKAESFQQESIRDDSMSLVNLHLPSSFGGGMLIIVILGLAMTVFENFWANKAACHDAEVAWQEGLAGCKVGQTDDVGMCSYCGRF